MQLQPILIEIYLNKLIKIKIKIINLLNLKFIEMRTITKFF